MHFRRKLADKKSVAMKLKPRQEEFLIRNITEAHRELRVFIGFVKSIVDISNAARRLLLIDATGDLIYCLLLGPCVKASQALQKGHKISLGPSQILKVPSNFKSFFAPESSRPTSDFYFHYDHTSLGIQIHDEISPLSNADLFGCTETSANILAGILDVKSGIYKHKRVQVLRVIDSSTKIPVLIYVQVSGKVFNIGDIIKVSGALFTTLNNIAVGVITEETEFTVISCNGLTREIPAEALLLAEYLHLLMEENGNSQGSEKSAYFCVLSSYNDFPEKGKCTFVLFDHFGFYFFVHCSRVDAQWVRVTGAKFVQRNLLLGEKTIVCGYPEWIEPVKTIRKIHKERLEIVMQETKRSTNYFDFIMIDK